MKRLLLVGLFLLPAAIGVSPASAAVTPMVDLGDASPYAVLSGASVGNTVSAPGAPHTTVRGDLGIKANAAPLGFPPGVVTGAIRYGSTVDAAHADLVSAYTEIADRTGGAPLAGALVGVTIPPGLHKITGAASNTGTVTLDAGGDPNAVFVIQVTGALAFAAGSHVVLTGGAKPSRVFWQAAGAGAVGAGGSFAGTLIARDAVGMGSGTIVNGRAFARDGALTLDNNQFYSAPPVVTITGGESAQTTDTTPTISGTTDVEAPGLVTVTIAGQTFTVSPSGGAWSATSAILPNGDYPVTATVQDGAGNPGRADQLLTVDTVLPEITITGGATVTTNDQTPTIGGTTDAAVDTVIQVETGSQSLRALVHANGAWNVTPSTLADGTYVISASVKDLAGNESTATQSLSVDSAAPAISITGGPTRLTNDSTPEISGAADLAPDSMVTLTLADETITGTVGVSGTWSVTAAVLSDGPHRIVLSATDAAGNEARATQILTVDTTLPLISIDGGATASTDRVDPTISGDSDAATGTTVFVDVAGHTMSALIQNDGSWNTYAGTVGEGTWMVEATVQDPAGNVGTASQTLTIGPAVEPMPHELTVTSTGNGLGTVSSSPTGTQFKHGTVVILTARASKGSEFSGWGGACSGKSSCAVTMDQDRSAVARFTDNMPMITALTAASGIRRLGPLIKLNVSEETRVQFVITRKFSRTQGFSKQLKQGVATFRIPWKLRKSLRQGRYQLSAIATDAIGQDSKSKLVSFRIRK